MIPEPIRPKLKKLALVLSSQQDNEALAARDAIDRLLRANGSDWHDFGALIGPQAPEPREQSELRRAPPWQHIAQACLDNSTRYNDKELKFLRDMSTWRAKPSGKQLDWLRDLHERAKRQWAEV